MPNQLPFWLLFIASLGFSGLSKAEESPTPVPFQKLEHYAPLWERSLFTTKDLPSPDAPTGPIFTDNLGLVGTYEVDGQFVAILHDRSTNLYTEARIGSENENGIKVRKVQPGATLDKTRVQLQKGDIAGWVGMPDAAAAVAEKPATQIRPAQPAHAPVASPLLPPPTPVEPAPQASAAPVFQPPIGHSASASAPAPKAGSAAPPAVNDVPLPPP